MKKQTKEKKVKYLLHLSPELYSRLKSKKRRINRTGSKTKYKVSVCDLINEALELVYLKTTEPEDCSDRPQPLNNA